MEHVERAAQWFAAAAVACWAALPQLTQLLLLLMVIDTALGLVKAIRERDLSAQVAWIGATKKIGTLLLVAVSAVLNPYVNNFLELNLMQAASAFYIIPELTSITRNAAVLDIPVFVQMQSIMRHFHAMAGMEDEAAPEEDEAAPNE